MPIPVATRFCRPYTSCQVRPEPFAISGNGVPWHRMCIHRILLMRMVFALTCAVCVAVTAGAQSAVGHVDIDITARPEEGRLTVRAALHLDRPSGRSAEGEERIYVQLTEPATVPAGETLENGQPVQIRYLMDRDTAYSAGYNIAELVFQHGREATTIVLEYEYDTASFSGSYFSPSGLGDIVYGQISRRGVYSTHLYYYPAQYPTTLLMPQSARITITTPPGWTAATAGVLLSREERSTEVVYRYEIDYPTQFVPYPLAIARYAVLRRTYADRVPVTIYVDPAHRAYGEEKLNAVCDRILPFLERLMGPYPWDQIRIAEVFPLEGEAGAALKGFIILSDYLYFAEPIDGDFTSMAATVLVDELAHQWNFHKVSYPGYLSEGISTYTDLLFHEEIYGKGELEREIAVYAERYRDLVDLLQEIRRYKERGLDSRETAEAMDRDLNAIAPYWAYADHGELPISDPDVLHTLYFYKGAVALHALRARLGDKAFFTGFRRAFDGPRDRAATLDDFRAVFEQAAGQDLSDFFRKWYLETGLSR